MYVFYSSDYRCNKIQAPLCREAGAATVRSRYLLFDFFLMLHEHFKARWFEISDRDIINVCFIGGVFSMSLGSCFGTGSDLTRGVIFFTVQNIAL